MANKNINWQAAFEYAGQQSTALPITTVGATIALVASGFLVCAFLTYLNVTLGIISIIILISMVFCATTQAALAECDAQPLSIAQTIALSFVMTPFFLFLIAIYMALCVIVLIGYTCGYFKQLSLSRLFIFAPFYICDQHTNPLSALTKSYQATRTEDEPYTATLVNSKHHLNTAIIAHAYRQIAPKDNQ